jgi:hypothetical protein
VTLVGGAGCGARGSGFVSRALGRPWVTVRPHYGGPPFSGLDGAGRAGRKPRARAGEEPAVRVPEATVRGPKSPRWSAGRRARRQRAPRARLRLLRSYGGLESAEARRRKGAEDKVLRLPALHPLGFGRVGRKWAARGRRKKSPRRCRTSFGCRIELRRYSAPPSFETRASHAPQDEDLVLRRPRSGRLEGRQLTRTLHTCPTSSTTFSASATPSSM